MSIPQFAPPLTDTREAVEGLRKHGFVVMCSAAVTQLTQTQPEARTQLADAWHTLPIDPYLKDGGHYRRRRHASLHVRDGVCTTVPHRAHFQSPEYNALHGGMMRWFEPIPTALTASPTWHALLRGTAQLCSAIDPYPEDLWHVEAHQFRIDTSEGIGRPTPEGAHRDGVDFVALFLIARERVRGGETRVFEADGPHGLRFTLEEPWSLLLMNDRRVIHETTPIQPLVPHDSAPGYRDTLVLTFRRAGFQEP